MNELCDYPSIKFDNNLYTSLKTKDSRILLRQMKTAIEFFQINQNLDEEMFTILYYGVQQIQKEEIFDFIQKEIINRQETLEFELLLLKFLQATQDDSFKVKRDQLINIIKDALFSFGQFDKHGQFGAETLLLFYKQKIKEIDIKQFLQGQFKKILKRDSNHSFCKNRLIQITFNSDDCDQQIADLIIYSENTAFITSFITILAQNTMELSQNENNSIKQVQKIFDRISMSLPNLFNQNLRVFLQFYDNENYGLRNTISTIISNILTEHLNPANVDQDIEMKEMQLNQRLILIQKLYSRIHDKNAFCRVHILKIIKLICNQNLIPSNVQLTILPLIIGRVQDSSSLVRKAALALIKQITKFMKNLFVDGLQLTNFMKINEIKEQCQLLEKDIHKILQAIDQILEEKGKTDSEQQFKELEDEENLVAANLRERRKLFQIFNQYEEFMVQIQQLLPNLELLLNSKCISDVLKVISLITFLFKLKIENTDVGVMKMLIHSNNPQIVIKLAKKFQNLFFDPQNDQITINNLIHLLKISSAKEQIYLEQLLSYLIKQKLVSEQLIETLWSNFIKSYYSNQGDYLSLYSKLIRITISQIPQLLNNQKLDQINKIIDGQKKEINWITVIELSKLIYYLEDKSLVKQYFCQLALIIYFNYGTPNCFWFVACQEILNLIQFLPVPESIFDYIIKKFTFKILQVKMTPKRTNESFLEEESSYDYNNHCIQLSQLLFIIGQSAMNIIIHIDDFENQLKHLKNVEEEQEIEIDKIQGGCEEEYEQNSLYLQSICKNSIMKSGFYYDYINIINEILDEYESLECQPSMLHKNACLCLCKLMCLNEEFCQQNIERIFKMIQKPYADGVFKNNLIVAFGDLLHRWPNTVTSYCRALFDDLSNQDFIVKKTSMNMLQHLILNDMIKIKKEITDIALLLTDLDENIQQQARKFFHQLQKKDSRRIINSLPDIINCMSNQDLHQKYKIFLNNTIKYFDKQTDQLVEKLLKRMKENINEWEIENIAFTLSKLQMKENLARKFYDCYSYYQERLEIPQIKEYFQIIIQKLMRCGLNQENKQILLEFEELLNKGETKRRIAGSKYKSQKSTRSQTNSQRSIGYSNVLDQIFTQNSDF